MGIEWLKESSEFLAQRKGLPVLVGAALVALNFVLRLLPAWPGVGWLVQVDLLVGDAL